MTYHTVTKQNGLKALIIVGIYTKMLALRVKEAIKRLIMPNIALIL